MKKNFTIQEYYRWNKDIQINQFFGRFFSIILSCVNTDDCPGLFLFLLNACRVTVFNNDDWFSPGYKTCMMKRDFYSYLYFNIYKKWKKNKHMKKWNEISDLDMSSQTPNYNLRWINDKRAAIAIVFNSHLSIWWRRISYWCCP